MYDDDHMRRMRMKQQNISQIESMGITSWLDEKKKTEQEVRHLCTGKVVISIAIKEGDILNNRF